MSRFIQVAFLASLFTFNSCAVKTKLQSNWNSDNQFSSQNFSREEANYYNSQNQISIKLFNNTEFVDVILETNSAKSLRKIYNLGVSIWIDPNGKSKNTFAIHYPMPIEFPFSQAKFENYLTRFSLIEFNEELMDRFQEFEVEDKRSKTSILYNTLQQDNQYKVKLSSTDQVLFSYHIRIPMEVLYPNKSTDLKTISIGIANINEANEEYHSALSSKEYINKRMDKLKAGTDENPDELSEFWTNFTIAASPNQ